MKIVSAVIALGLLATLPARGETLHLACLGAGSANRPTNDSVYAYDNSGNSAWGQSIGQRTVPFDDQVNIELDEASGKIRMPRAMLPPLHGGEGGWFEIKSIKRSDTEITGTIQVNIINSPKLRLDRMTGRVAINGKSGDYSGECQPYDPATAERKF